MKFINKEGMKPIYKFIIMLLSLPISVAFLLGFDYLLLLAQWASMGHWMVYLITSSISFVIGLGGAFLIKRMIYIVDTSWMETGAQWLVRLSAIAMCLIYLYSVWFTADKSIDQFYTFAILSSIGYIFVSGYLMTSGE